ncbi:hypothetical protein B0T21DRAFT_354697 [Apiosordaria backusii]|uniref:Uncharacterized protein n=1 Tax=Apiosordaria backusii TaxID=314023 RepID=A0AA40K6C3_9PEZI|nr:hypothetical protein B0T21DRAFT_354697 [Apiosordaria backusii]
MFPMDKLRKRMSRTTTTLEPVSVTFQVRLDSNNRHTKPIQVLQGSTTVGEFNKMVAKEFGIRAVKLRPLADMPKNLCDDDILTEHLNIKMGPLTVDEDISWSTTSRPGQKSPSEQGRSPSTSMSAAASAPASQLEKTEHIIDKNEQDAGAMQLNYTWATFTGKASITENKSRGEGQQYNLIGGDNDAFVQALRMCASAISK